MSLNSALGDLIRGGQMAMHSLNMLRQILRYALLLSLGSWVFIFGLLVYFKVKPYDAYLIAHSVGVHLKMQYMGPSFEHTFDAPNGRMAKLKAVDFMKHPERRLGLARGTKVLVSSVRQSFSISVIIFIVCVIFLQARGHAKKQDKRILGQERFTAKRLAKHLRKWKKASDFEIAGVPLVKDSEYQHILLAGTTGTGKSLCMQELMDQVRARNERAIVYDIDGAFIPYYYRAERDILLNPLDARSRHWNLWEECQSPSDFDSAAHSLIASPRYHSDPFWIDSARSVFASAAQTLYAKGQCHNRFLLDPLFSKDLRSLAALLVHTPAEALISDQNEKTALSIKATLATYCKSLTYLQDEGPLFSIREWVAREDDDSWLFIASNAQTMDALKPLISLWLNVATKSLLSLPSQQEDDKGRGRLWFFLDELASLHRLPSLGTVLSRGRKYGAAVTAALQDIHQLYTLYGKDEADVLSSLFNTKVFFRCQEPESSQWMSRNMGSVERLEQKESFSYGAHPMRDGVSMHEARLKEALIKDTEFLSLPDLEAFLKCAGNTPLTHLQFVPRKRARLGAAFVPLPSSRGQGRAAKADPTKRQLLLVPKLAFQWRAHPPYPVQGEQRLLAC